MSLFMTAAQLHRYRENTFKPTITSTRLVKCSCCGKRRSIGQYGAGSTRCKTCCTRYPHN